MKRKNFCETENCKFVVRSRTSDNSCEMVCEYDTMESAEDAIDDELMYYKNWFSENDISYECVECDGKTEIFVPGGEIYACWERMWLYGGVCYEPEKIF